MPLSMFGDPPSPDDDGRERENLRCAVCNNSAVNWRIGFLTCRGIPRANREGIMKRLRFNAVVAAVVALFLAVVTAAGAADRLKPYVLAEQAPGTLDAKVAAVRQDIQGAGFEIAGEVAVK